MGMAKIIGSLCLLISSLFTAFLMVEREKKKRAQLRRFIDLIRYIQRSIEAFNLPLGEIIKRVDTVLVSDCEISAGDFIKPKSELLVSEKDEKSIKEFFSSIGKGYRDEQIKLCSYYVDELEDSLSQTEADFPKKRRLTYTLSICAALGAIILML